MMNSITLIGAIIITIAFLLYGIGNISLQRFKMVSPGVIWFLSLGILLDMVATVFLIAGSSNHLFSARGFIRYSALLVMLVEVILIWRLYLTRNLNATIGEKLRAYSRVAISWWIIAYITGNLMVILK